MAPQKMGIRRRNMLTDEHLAKIQALVL